MGVKNISFKPKSSKELSEIVSESKVILDVNDIKQQGLTIRTLETLLAGKKIITTNADIINYDFYNPENVCVIDREHIQIPKNFFEKKYVPIEYKILKKYTAEGWVRDVFKL